MIDQDSPLTNDPIEQFLAGRLHAILPGEENWRLYWYESQRLTYALMLNAIDGELHIGADVCGTMPFGAHGIFEVSLNVDELVFAPTNIYGRPCLSGYSRSPDGDRLVVIEIMVRDDGDLIIWPRGHQRTPPTA